MEARGLLVPMHVTATDVLQTGRETVDSEPIDPEEIDWRDVLDEGGAGESASAAMRHQVFIPEDNSAHDALRTAIKESDNVARLAREANLGRQTVYDFLAGGSLRPKTRKKIEAALRRFAGSGGNMKEP
jgi:DNA-binding phage protein